MPTNIEVNPLAIQKWYDTQKLAKKWPFYEAKREELHFFQIFQIDLKGLFWNSIDGILCFQKLIGVHPNGLFQFLTAGEPF